MIALLIVQGQLKLPEGRLLVLMLFLHMIMDQTAAIDETYSAIKQQIGLVISERLDLGDLNAC